MSEEIRKVSIRTSSRVGVYKPDLTLCRANVHESGRSMGSYQCQKKAKVFRDVIVQGQEAAGVQSVGFCTTHDPVKVEEREAARRAQWVAERDARNAKAARKQERPEDYAEALRSIAAGHNDPRAVAAEVLSKWGDN